MGREIFDMLPWQRRKSPFLSKEDGERIDVGSMLVEKSDVLPPHLYLRWRVEKRIEGPGKMTHVTLRSIDDRHTTKLLSVSALVDARRYELRDKAEPQLVGLAAE
jgi:hypothetical protein